jgi:group I intron endonuclease
MIIYKTINLINNKIYIGKQKLYTISYFGSGKLIKAAIKKYGKQNFKKEIVQECFSLKELNEQETFWILKLESFKKEIGYNISFGGDGGDTISNNPHKDDIIKRQKSTKLKNGTGIGEKNHMFGKHHSKEHKQKTSNTIKELYATGKIKRYRMTDEGKKKMSKWMKENCPTKTPEGRIKNRENNLGIKNPNAHIYEFISPEGNIFEVKGNVKQFCKLNSISYKQLIKIYNSDKTVNGWKCKKISKIHNK